MFILITILRNRKRITVIFYFILYFLYIFDKFNEIQPFISLFFF